MAAALRRAAAIPAPRLASGPVRALRTRCVLRVAFAITRSRASPPGGVGVLRWPSVPIASDKRQAESKEEGTSTDPLSAELSAKERFQRKKAKLGSIRRGHAAACLWSASCLASARHKLLGLGPWARGVAASQCAMEKDLCSFANTRASRPLPSHDCHIGATLPNLLHRHAFRERKARQPQATTERGLTYRGLLAVPPARRHRPQSQQPRE